MTSLSKTHKKRGGAILAVFAIVASLIIGFAPPAFAHHSEIEAGTTCAGKVSWKATAWGSIPPQTSAQRTNTSVRVWYRVGNAAIPSARPSAPVAGDVEIATGAFNSTNNYRFGSTASPALPEFDFPVGQTQISVFVQEQVKWGSGPGVGAPRKVLVTAPRDCNPEIKIVVTCTTVKITSTKDLSNIIWQQGPANSQKIEGLSSPTHELTNDPTNPITAVWVKSGNNKVVSPPDPLPNPPNNNNQGIGAYFAVAAPTGCTGTPKATATVTCSESGGTVAVKLENTGGALPVTYKVTNPTDNADVRTVEVAVGATKTENFTGVPDGTYDIKVIAKYPGGTDIDKTITGVEVDCNGVPNVTSKVECTTTGGTVTITLKNEGPNPGKPVTFTVQAPGGQPVQYVVAAGQSQDVVFNNVPDGQQTYKVAADGKALSDVVLTVNCAGTPTVDKAVECTTTGGKVTLTLSNTAPVNFKPVTFVVTPPTGAPVQEVVAAGQSTTVVFNDVPDGVQSYQVTADGKALAGQTVTVNCSGVGSATVAKECTDNDGTVIITLSNTGPNPGKPVKFVVTPPTGPLVERTVAAGQSTEVKFSGIADGSYTYDVTADEEPLADLKITVDCDDPGVPVVDSSVACTALGGDVTILLINDGAPGKNLPVTFRVTDPRDGTTQDVTVDPGQTKPVVLPAFEDGSYTIPVDVVHGLEAVGVLAVGRQVADVSFDQQVNVACQPVATFACATGGQQVTLRNGGGVDALMGVRKNGQPVGQPVLVKAFGGTAPVLVPMNEDETATIAVTIDGIVASSQTTTQDCLPPPPTPTTAPPEVLGVTQTPAAVVVTPGGALPYTGLEVARTVLVALGLLLAGTWLAVAAKRRNP